MWCVICCPDLCTNIPGMLPCAERRGGASRDRQLATRAWRRSGCPARKQMLFIGWANDNVNNLHFKQSLETKNNTWNGIREIIDDLVNCRSVGCWSYSVVTYASMVLRSNRWSRWDEKNTRVAASIVYREDVHVRTGLANYTKQITRTLTMQFAWDVARSSPNHPGWGPVFRV